MKLPYARLRLTLGLLASVGLLAPLALRAEDPPADKPAKAKGPDDTNKDGKVSAADEGKPGAGANDQARPMSEEDLKKALKKYDANGNGRLDDDELARMKADEAEANARRSAAAEKKVDVRTEKRIDQAIKKPNKATKVPKKR